MIRCVFVFSSGCEICLSSSWDAVDALPAYLASAGSVLTGFQLEKVPGSAQGQTVVFTVCFYLGSQSLQMPHVLKQWRPWSFHEKQLLTEECIKYPKMIGTVEICVSSFFTRMQNNHSSQYKETGIQLISRTSHASCILPLMNSQTPVCNLNCLRLVAANTERVLWKGPQDFQFSHKSQLNSTLERMTIYSAWLQKQESQWENSSLSFSVISLVEVATPALPSGNVTFPWLFKKWKKTPLYAG